MIFGLDFSISTQIGHSQMSNFRKLIYLHLRLPHYHKSTCIVSYVLIYNVIFVSVGWILGRGYRVESWPCTRKNERRKNRDRVVNLRVDLISANWLIDTSDTDDTTMYANMYEKSWEKCRWKKEHDEYTCTRAIALHGIFQESCSYSFSMLVLLDSFASLPVLSVYS